LRKNPFANMVEVCQSLAGQSIVSPLPNHSEWMKKNMPLIQRGLYQKKESIRPKFTRSKRHYEKKAK